MQRSRRQGLGIWLLLYQIFGVIGINNIPPATIVITALQIFVYLRVIPIPWHSPSDVCISVDGIWYRKQWIRLLYGAIEHGSDVHLYYNMISFIWKGISLERRFGSARFAYLISVFTALCSVTLVALCQVASQYADRNYYHHCAVGFSGVIFALKVLTSHYWPHGLSYVMGLPLEIPLKYLVWVELLLIQVLVPNASFVGHLAGILVGLAYLHTPVGYLIDTAWKMLEAIIFLSPGQSNRFHSTNVSGRHTPSTNYARYAPQDMTEEEQFEFARQESLRSRYGGNNYGTRNPAPSAPYPESYSHSGENYPNVPYPETDNIRPQIPRHRLYPDLDELRNSRNKRFSSFM